MNINIQTYNKFIVALVGLLAIVLKHAGVDGIEDLSAELIATLTALGVFFIPNK